MLILLSFIFILSLIFFNLSHPLAMGLTLLVQTTLISITSGLVNKTFWFSYLLFLIFLGGMLVLFIYVSSLASNEQFILNNYFLFIIFFLLLLFLFFFFMMDPLLLNNKIQISYSSFIYPLNSSMLSELTSTLYNSPSMMLTLFIISYLLLTLLIIVKIMMIFSSPLQLSN
uniref:NADH-ubiquinone oxidoreductase chain 6 n=1 Tax=Kiwa tyleri TaxID=1676998 RepID=A0A343CXC4_KIWTY|nr:NADH dehydrogenase subunit 6 [Kiwa tyleri]ARQ27019.1 NADH dehydrogenase subunit 6 [Kiwa tyleri]